jgi:hypothetical protein
MGQVAPCIAHDTISSVSPVLSPVCALQFLLCGYLNAMAVVILLQGCTAAGMIQTEIESLPQCRLLGLYRRQPIPQFGCHELLFQRTSPLAPVETALSLVPTEFFCVVEQIWWGQHLEYRQKTNLN